MGSPVSGSAVLVVNMASRYGADGFEFICRELIGRGIDLVAAYPVRKPHQMVKVVEHEIAAGRRLIILGGGDGTVTMVSHCFIGKDAVMGLLPLGTGNSFARGLGLPLNFGAAADTLVHGKVAAVDLGIVNGHAFANFTTLGLTTVVARTTRPLLKRILGPISYVLTGILLARHHRPFDCRIVADDGPHRFQTHQLVIANGRVFGATPIHPDARVDEGLLTVFAVPGASRDSIRATWEALLAGRQADLKGALFIATKRLTLRTKPRRAIDLDGEVVTRTPATYSVAPRALKIIVPLEFRETPL
jgi:YegS/Rv2252/BmrU family lipid kinase